MRWDFVIERVGVWARKVNWWIESWDCFWKIIKRMIELEYFWERDVAWVIAGVDLRL